VALPGARGLVRGGLRVPVQCPRVGRQKLLTNGGACEHQAQAVRLEVAVQARLPVGQTLPSAERRHAPGWVDHLQVFVERLPWPWWASYLLLWAGLAMAETSAKWAAGVYPVGTIFSFHLMAFGVVPYALALMHFLDSQATKS